MPLVKVKPTSPGRRALVKVVTPELHKGDPFWPLTQPQKRGSGRNNYGRITTRHQGGGHKHHLRLIDFRRNKDGIAAKVERLEYDPNRSAHVALLLYADGERRYIIAPKGLTAGTQLISGMVMAITADKSQRVMMFVLPLIFVPFVINFPAGLVLYWVTTNLWTVGQGLVTRRLVPKTPLGVPGAAGLKRSSKGTVEQETPAPKPPPAAKPQPQQPRRVKRKKGGARR